MSSMRIIALGLVLLLASCHAASRQAHPQAQPGRPPAHVSDQTSTETGQWPKEAIAYLQQSLEHPDTSGSPLGPVCQVIAQIPEAGTDPAFAGMRQAVLRWRGQMGESVASEIAAAWLALEPGPASDQIVKRIAKGDDAIMQAMMFDAAAGRAILARVDQAKLTPMQADRVMMLLRYWGGAEAGDKPLLEHLTKQAPVIAWRAWGYLVKLEPQNQDYLNKLETAVRSAKPEQLSTAMEAAKISGCPKMADAIVQYVAQAKLGPERIEQTTSADASSKGKDKPGGAKHDALPVMLGSYALTYLPGEQAQYARHKLLEAEDPLLRWQARLGELLHGDAKSWDEAVRQQGVEQDSMWVALEPPEAWDAALIPVYAKAAQSKEALIRGKTALHLNRYSACQSDKRILAALSRLAADSTPEVRQAAWYTLGKLRLDPTGADPITVINDAQAPAGVRLAAAYTALRLAGQAANK